MKKVMLQTNNVINIGQQAITSVENHNYIHIKYHYNSVYNT